MKGNGVSDKLPSWVIAALRSVGACVIALLFIVLLMTASAQQEVMGKLAGLDLGVSYSSAYATALKVDQARRDLSAARGSEAQYIAKARQERAALNQAEAAYNEAWENFAPAALAFSKRPGCALPSNPTQAMGTDERKQIVAVVRECLLSGRISREQAASMRKLIESPRGVPDSFRRAVDAANRVKMADDNATMTGDRIKVLEQEDAKAAAIRDCFDTTTKLRSSILLGGDVLIDFPPALLQIVLAFVSGTFGALLLTLVLVVYPATSFTLTSSAGYSARILLGGLIALCVFILLSGGTAVLGTSSGFAGGEANYMAFCAVGILAGMFSDRAASWLSERADTFFGKKDE